MQKGIAMKIRNKNIAKKHKNLSDFDKFALMTEPLRRSDGSLDDFLVNDIRKFLGSNFGKMCQEHAVKFVLAVERKELSLRFWDRFYRDFQRATS